MATTPNNNGSVSFRITLDAQQVEKLNFLRSDNSNTLEQEFVTSAIFGIDNRSYRKGYMAKRNQAVKQLPAQLAKAQGKIAELEARLKAASEAAKAAKAAEASETK